MTDSYNKEAVIETAIQTSTQLQTIEEKTIAKDILELLLEGYTKAHIIEKLEIEEKLYNKLLKKTLVTHQPLPEDVNFQRDLAHQRYLKLLVRFQEIADNAETDSQEMWALKEIRATVKEIGDIYSIKMPEKLEIDVNVNHHADEIAKQLIKALSPSPDLALEEHLEAEIVEEKDLGTAQLEELKKNSLEDDS